MFPLGAATLTDCEGRSLRDRFLINLTCIIRRASGLTLTLNGVLAMSLKHTTNYSVTMAVTPSHAPNMFFQTISDTSTMYQSVEILTSFSIRIRSFLVRTLPCRDSNRRPRAWQADDLPMSQLTCFKKSFILLHHYLFTNEEFKNTALLYIKGQRLPTFSKKQAKIMLKKQSFEAWIFVLCPHLAKHVQDCNFTHYKAI